MILIAFVGHVSAAANTPSSDATFSELTIAFGFIILSFCITSILGARISQLAQAIQGEGSTITRKEFFYDFLEFCICRPYSCFNFIFISVNMIGI